ncbi:MAG: hypothetical protein ACKOW3_02650 [Hyphomicrobium sp.]
MSKFKCFFGPLLEFLIFIAPTVVMAGEFKNLCANALAEGRVFQTNCSIKETIKGRVFCFGNEENRQAFMKDPDANLDKATDTYLALNKEK